MIVATYVMIEMLCSTSSSCFCSLLMLFVSLLLEPFRSLDG